MSSFAGASPIGCTPFAAQAPRDGGVLGFGAGTNVPGRTSRYLRYDGDLDGANTKHGLNASVRYVR